MTSMADIILQAGFGKKALEMAESIIPGGEGGIIGNLSPSAGKAEGFVADQGKMPLAGTRGPK